MQPQSAAKTLVRIGSLCVLAWLGGVQAAGITAVTRQTVMSGVPGGAFGNAAVNASGSANATVVSPQPTAAAAMLLPGQTPLAATRAGARVRGKAAVAVTPPPLRPGPGEALMARPAAPVAPKSPVRPAGVVHAVAPAAGQTTAAQPVVSAGRAVPKAAQAARVTR